MARKHYWRKFWINDNKFPVPLWSPTCYTKLRPSYEFTVFFLPLLIIHCWLFINIYEKINKLQSNHRFVRWFVHRNVQPIYNI